MTGVLGNTEIGLCRAMWLRERKKEWTSKMLKKQKSRKGKNKTVYKGDGI